MQCVPEWFLVSWRRVRNRSSRAATAQSGFADSRQIIMSEVLNHEQH
jgi:hypothetical protein